MDDKIIKYIDKNMSLDYSNHTVVWKNIPKNNKKAKIGKEIGSLDTKGYRRVLILGIEVKCHRIIWYLHYNYWPNDFIDHINGNPLDNTIENLRVVSTRQNSNNLKRHRQGYLVGAHYRKDTQKWRARIHINGKQLTIGTYKNELDAHNAYIEYCKENNIDI